jgi:cytochrome c5
VNAESHRPHDFLESIKGSQDEGAQIYSHFCSNCHAQKPLIALGAPRFREENDWTGRLKQDIKVLFLHTEEGMNAMPPRGGCFECSDDQLILAIIEMVPSKAKISTKNDLENYKKSIK